MTVIDSRTSPKRPPWGQKKAAVLERFKQESMYGLSATKKSPCREVAVVDVRLYHLRLYETSI